LQLLAVPPTEQFPLTVDPVLHDCAHASVAIKLMSRGTCHFRGFFFESEDNSSFLPFMAHHPNTGGHAAMRWFP